MVMDAEVMEGLDDNEPLLTTEEIDELVGDEEASA